GVGDGVAEAAPREDEFAGDHADEGVGERELESGEEIWHRRWKDNAERFLDTSEAVHPRKLSHHARHSVEAIERGDHHGGRAEDEADGDERPAVETEDRDEQRIEDKEGHRVV